MRGGGCRAATRELGGPPPPRFMSAVGAQAHSAVSTQLHYTTGTGGSSTLRLSVSGGEQNCKGDPGEELRGPTMKLRSSGLAISWLGIGGLDLEEAPLPGERPLFGFGN